MYAAYTWKEEKSKKKTNVQVVKRKRQWKEKRETEEIQDSKQMKEIFDNGDDYCDDGDNGGDVVW